MHIKSIKKDEWDNVIKGFLLSYDVYAPVRNEFGQDYELIEPESIHDIIYNTPKPSTPLKNFFLPVRENVTSGFNDGKKRVIIGIPNCDIEALNILDEIYLDKEFNDIFYNKRRSNTILISSDCFSIQEHCHCLSYGIKPYSTALADISVNRIEDEIVLKVFSARGEELLRGISGQLRDTDKVTFDTIENENRTVENLLRVANPDLPDYRTTGELVRNADINSWKKHSLRCVSCGACTTICPTCTCFILIDKPDFEKVKQTDACQYPGFQAVAGGEDPLKELYNRFKNRYMCKYVWKPEKFRSLACTGCGRCIEACIGKISKNELFIELVMQKV